MTKTIALAIAFALMCGTAIAQTSTGPANQSDTMTKPGMSKSTGMGNNSGMMNRSTHRTVGMSNDSMSKRDMNKKHMSKHMKRDMNN